MTDKAKKLLLAVRVAAVTAGGLMFWLLDEPWNNIGWILFLVAVVWGVVYQQTQPWRDDRRRRLRPDHGQHRKIPR
ncbi:MAG: hypothetical protein OXG50_04910 [bacterium]|nr:hypothetical protein [bacterium]